MGFLISSFASRPAASIRARGFGVEIQRQRPQRGKALRVRRHAFPGQSRADDGIGDRMHQRDERGIFDQLLLGLHIKPFMSFSFRVAINCGQQIVISLDLVIMSLAILADAAKVRRVDAVVVREDIIAGLQWLGIGPHQTIAQLEPPGQTVFGLRPVFGCAQFSVAIAFGSKFLSMLVMGSMTASVFLARS